MAARDFTVDGHGTVFLLTPHTERAKSWVLASLSEDRTELGNSIAVEHRYIVDIVEALRNEGFNINT